jgi:hypothetical protein
MLLHYITCLRRGDKDGQVDEDRDVLFCGSFHPTALGQ